MKVNFYGYGIVNGSGKVELMPHDYHKDTYEAMAGYWNDSVPPIVTGGPYRVVELLYKTEE